MLSQWWASTSPYATSTRSCWICFPSATRTRATRSGRRRVVGWPVSIFWTSRSLPLYSFPSFAFSLGYIRRADELPYYWARLELVQRCKKKMKGEGEIRGLSRHSCRRCDVAAVSVLHTFSSFLSPFFVFFFILFFCSPPPPVRRLSPLALSLALSLSSFPSCSLCRCSGAIWNRISPKWVWGKRGALFGRVFEEWREVEGSHAGLCRVKLN